MVAHIRFVAVPDKVVHVLVVEVMPVGMRMLVLVAFAQVQPYAQSHQRPG